MIVRSGNAASFLVEFPSGHPDGDIDWELLGENGASIATGSVVVPVDAVSVTITVDALNNTLTGGALASYRDLTWSYTVGGSVINGEQRYDIEARVPFGVSPDGVRRLLGVDRHDLPDDQIALIPAYDAFSELTNNVPITVNSTDSLKVRFAIEALAALILVPTMKVRVAIKEQSGNDSFQRDKIDWDALAAALQQVVDEGVIIINPTYDPTNTDALFILASPTDEPFPGA